MCTDGPSLRHSEYGVTAYPIRHASSFDHHFQVLRTRLEVDAGAVPEIGVG